jgi:hypothetical protein
LWSYEGKRLVSLRDIASGKELGTLQAAVTALTFSPDSQSLALAEIKNGVLLWDAKSGKQKQRLPFMKASDKKDGNVYDLAFTPDAKKLAACLWKEGNNSSLRFWDLFLGQEIPAVVCDHHVNSIAFSPNGCHMAVAGGNDFPITVSVWDLRRNRQLFRFRKHRDAKVQLAFSPTGRFLATAGSRYNDNIIYLWELATGQAVRSLEGHHSGVGCLVFSPDGKMLVSGGGDATVLAWDLTYRQQDGTFHAQSLAPAELESRWQDLARRDATKAFRTMWELVAAGEQTLALLRDRLRPVMLPDAAAVAQLLADLDSQSFNVRQKAGAGLEKLGDGIETALRKALPQSRSLETRRRLEALLKAIEDPMSKPEKLREMRAVEIVERIGNAEARTLLERLAHGAPESWLTREARDALERLRKG